MPFLIILIIVFSIWIGRWVYVQYATPRPTYQVLKKEGGFEIRKYDPYIMAELEVNGDSHLRAASNGFMGVAGYIFGDNQSQKKVSMTAPVIASEKIAMTAPVMAQKGESSYKIAFIMPQTYKTIEDLPKPNNPKLKLIQKPSQTFATIQYGWIATTKRALNKTQKLEAWMNQNNLEALAPPIQAYYDEPWAPPFLRRNEVLIEIERER